MADEIDRWAAERGSELLARAEAEAVAVLRNALVEAAIARREKTEEAPTGARPVPRPVVAPVEAAPGAEALWAYAVVGAADPVPRGLSGVDPARPVERVEAGDLAVLLSRVPLEQFGAEPLRRNLNDLDWLARVARAHEAVLDQALQASTLVPLRLCTIYESEGGVRAMLEREREAFTRALEHLAGRQEWAVKLLVDPETIAAAARGHSDDIAELESDVEGRSEGGAYMLRRRIERQVRDRADAMAAEVAEDVHARLEAYATDAVSRPPQNRDLSGHEGEMLLNGAYLVEDEHVDGLRDLVAELEQRHRALGARLDLSGPWPPYNFVPGDAGTIA